MPQNYTNFTHTHTHTHTHNSGHTTTILHTEPTTTLYSTELLTGYTNSLVCNTNFPNEIKQRYHNSLY